MPTATRNIKPKSKSKPNAPLPVIFLMGATGCGKTALAAGLSRLLDCELVSVDAAQVYRGLDIGTAKPSADFLRQYPHHLIDICEPTEHYSAARFCADARNHIAEIHGLQKIPLLVGGSLFYFAALENGLSELPSADPQTRRQIGAQMQQRGAAAMHAELTQIDPEIAAQIRATDPQRIQRALEIYHLSQRPPSQLMAQSTPARLPFPLIKLGLFCPDRAVLHQRLEARFSQMLKRGLVAEVEALFARISQLDNAPSMRSVGYRQVRDYLRGDCSYDAMRERAVAATRQLAKRQLTWMRQQSNLVWVDFEPAPLDALRTYLRERLGERWVS